MVRQEDSFPMYLFHEGTNYEAHKLFSPHRVNENGVDGWLFTVWAPNAKGVSVVGDFNNWNNNAHPMKWVDGGIWQLFIPHLEQYTTYKYAVTQADGKVVLKADPYGLHFETPPANASKLYDITQYHWKDNKWMQNRKSYNPFSSPMNIYEIHFGSWKKYADGNFIVRLNQLVILYRSDEIIPY